MPSIGRLFVEIGGDKSNLDKSLRDALSAAKNAGLEVKRSGQAFISSFNNALNPTTKLTEKVKLLQKAGKTNAQIYSVMGGQINAAHENGEGKYSACFVGPKESSG